MITAHPDDEALYSGGIIAKVAAAGRHVALVTLTRGGAGRTLGMCRSDALAAMREAELRRPLKRSAWAISRSSICPTVPWPTTV